MPYQLLYLHGDLESTKIHISLNKTVIFSGTLHCRIHESKEIAVGYAFCLMDHPDIFINDIKKGRNLSGAGYFGVIDTEKNRMIAVVEENKE